jgi:hypothetical protein
MSYLPGQGVPIGGRVVVVVWPKAVFQEIIHQHTEPDAPWYLYGVVLLFIGSRQGLGNPGSTGKTCFRG